MNQFVSILVVFLSTQVFKTGAVCKASYGYKRLYTRRHNITLIGGFVKSFTARNQENCENECFLMEKNDCYKFSYHNVTRLCGLMYRGVSGSYRVKEEIGSTVSLRKCGGKPCFLSTLCFLHDNSNTICLCPPPLNTTTCTDGWLKVNTEPLCFGAKNDDFGNLTVPYDGKISGLKLKHLSGGVKSIDSQAQGYWGTGGSKADLIEVIVTDGLNTKVTPPEDYPFHGITGNTTYSIQDVTNMSPEIVLPEFSLLARNSQELRIWLIEDLVDGDEADNSGVTCTDVYLKYDY